MKERQLRSYELSALMAGVLMIAGFFAASRLNRNDVKPDRLRCAIELNNADDTAKGLLTGYNYHLLERFAAENGIGLDIRLSRKGDNYVDSLKTGTTDMVVVPYGVAGSIEGVETSIPVDSISVWLVPKGAVKTKTAIDRWIHSYHNSDCHESTRRVFLDTYDPIKLARSGRKLSFISPYDHIVQQYADSLGWDWRLLSAVIYQESRFKIDSRSHRGAIGLMQMMPHTAERWSEGDIVNPEKSIKAGANYLKSIQRHYFRVTSNPDERQKITLAAYNAGEGRIRDVINLARLRGVSTEYWDSLVTVIPEMRDSSAMECLDTVKLGVFKGYETITYVDRVLSLYDAFCSIYKEDSDERR